MTHATHLSLSRPSPLFEALEQRQLLSVSPVYAGTKIKGINLSSNGISTNQTLITIPFTGNVNIADASKIQVRGYAIDPLTGHQKKMVVGVVSSNIVAADHSYLQITTDRLMRKGGQIILYSGALKDDNGNLLAQQTVKTVKGQNKERFTLACRAFIATDLTKFTNATYSAAPNPSPDGTAVPEATARTNLQNFLQEKVNLGIITPTIRNKTMNRFDDANTQAIIPDPNLRAAVLSLVGTLAESAISSYLDGANATGKPYTIIDFDTPPDPTVPVLQTIYSGNNGRLRIDFRPEYKGESFLALSAFFAHEAVHQDTAVALPEDEFANVAEIMVYAQQALVDPTFLSNQSLLVNRENERLYAMLESGQAIFPYVGLEDAPILHGPSIFYGSDVTPPYGTGPYTSFINYIEREYTARGDTDNSTPGNNVLDAYYTAITGKAASNGMQFSDSLINDIDGFQAIISTTNAITLAGDLKLGIS